MTKSTALQIRRTFTKQDNTTLLKNAFQHLDSENSKLTTKVNELRQLKNLLAKCVSSVKEKIAIVNEVMVNSLGQNKFKSNDFFNKSIPGYVLLQNKQEKEKLTENSSSLIK